MFSMHNGNQKWHPPDRIPNRIKDKDLEDVIEQMLGISSETKSKLDKGVDEFIERTKGNGEIRCSIVDSGGNMTMLVEAGVGSRERIEIGRSCIRSGIAHQVGMVHKNENGIDALLTMMGEEFCLDGTRAVSSILAKDDPRDPKKYIRCSGREEAIACTCQHHGEEGDLTITADITERIRRKKLDVCKTKKLDMQYCALVDMEGISHLLCELPENADITTMGPANFHKIYNMWGSMLENRKAIGAIFFQEEKLGYRIRPIISVRQTNTLVQEESCGSGSCALAIDRLLHSVRENTIHIVQPSGAAYFLQTEYNTDDNSVHISLSSNVAVVRQWNIADAKDLIRSIT